MFPTIAGGLNAFGAIVSFELNPGYDSEGPVVHPPTPYERVFFVSRESRIAFAATESRAIIIDTERRIAP